jgi:hypothetical protein
VIKQQVKSTVFDINVSELTTGMFFIKLVNQEKTEYGKFIRQ